MKVIDCSTVPFFSIVIPVYNREKEIIRALNSCFAQAFTDLEVVVVDDASQDQTRAAVASFDDPRIVLITHEKNRGVCPARNTGIRHSHGRWVLFLDSDDELAPGALQKIFKYADTCPEEIERLGFIFQRDDGRYSPEPVPIDSVLDYEAYVSWSAHLRPSDFFHCTRRRAFAKVMFAESRAFEGSYLLDFAKEYRTRMIPEIVALVHTDSANRASNISDREIIDNLLRVAADEAASADYILTRHGTVLSQKAPNRYKIYRKAQVLFSFLDGKRWEGCRLAVNYLRNFPGSIEGWVICLAGMTGPYTLARVKLWKMKALAKK
jgi:glycosyltransferase involved in cell wall biosynthesis